MNEATREIRSIECQLAVREVDDSTAGQPSRTIFGRAILFNTESEVLDDWGMRFREIILPEAVTAEWLKTQDVKLNMLHDRNLTIARCNKGDENASLRLTVTNEGVEFEFDAPKCDIGDRALELVRTGVYSGCSFEFYPQDYSKEELGDELLIKHSRFKALTALTIGMDPAYTATSVNAREIINDIHPKVEEKAPEKKKTPDAELREKQEAMAAEMRRRLDNLKAVSAANLDF